MKILVVKILQDEQMCGMIKQTSVWNVSSFALPTGKYFESETC